MYRKLYICGFLIFTPIAILICQSIIVGKLTSTSDEPIPIANITIHQLPNSSILGYDISDYDGKFTIAVTSSLDSLFVEFSHLTYARTGIWIKNKSQQISIILKEDNTILPSMVIKDNTVRRSGDTLEFKADGLRQREGESIETLLRRIPGIEIKGGQIYYQDLPISKFTIEGLDLLDGRYGVITNDLNSRVIQSIQVLERHQSIRALDSIWRPPNAAINLTLKQETVFSTNGDASLGVPPFAYNGKMNEFIFQKKQQANFTFASNNISTFNGYLTRNFIYMLDDNPSPHLLVTPTSVANNIKPNGYINNNDQIVVGNAIRKLGKFSTLRVNGYFDKTKWLTSQNQTRTYLLPQTKLILEEQLATKLLKREWNIKPNFEYNGNLLYINNTTEVTANSNSDSSKYIYTSINSSERLEDAKLMVVNTQNLILKKGKSAYSIKSAISYTKHNANLLVSPISLFQDDISKKLFGSVNQNLDVSRFESDIYTTFYKRIIKAKVSTDIGYKLERYTTSALTSDNIIMDIPIGVNYLVNNLITSHTSYMRNFAKWEWPKMKINFSLPLQFVSFNQTIDEMQNKSLFTGVTYQPEVTFSKVLSRKYGFEGSYNFSKKIGGSDNIYQGQILFNNRNVTQGNTSMAKLNNQNSNAKLKYTDDIQRLYFILELDGNLNQSNLLNNNNIETSGVLNSQVLSKNTNYNLSSSLSGRKYFVTLNSSVGVIIKNYISIIPQIINDVKSDFKIESRSIEPYINYQASQLGFKASINVSQLKNGLNKLNYYQPSLKVGYSLSEKSSIDFDATSSRFSKDDISYQWLYGSIMIKHIFSKKLNFQAQITNISNENTFIRLSQYANSDELLRLSLRPRQFVLLVNYKL